MKEKEKIGIFPGSYVTAWENFNARKKAYETLCQSGNAQAKKSDRIATELYNFVDTQLREKYKVLKEMADDDLITNTPKSMDSENKFWKVLHGREMLEDFTQLINLAI